MSSRRRKTGRYGPPPPPTAYEAALKWGGESTIKTAQVAFTGLIESVNFIPLSEPERHQFLMSVWDWLHVEVNRVDGRDYIMPPSTKRLLETLMVTVCGPDAQLNMHRGAKPKI